MKLIRSTIFFLTCLLAINSRGQDINIKGGAFFKTNGANTSVRTSSITVDGASTLDITNTDLNISGNWSLDGNFISNESRVIFDGTSTQTLGGSVSPQTFNILEFSPGTRISVNSGLTIEADSFAIYGTANQKIAISASNPGNEAFFQRSNGPVVFGQFVDLQDIHGIGSANYYAINSTNISNNVGWIFSESFITTWQTNSPNESITIPLFPGETYNYLVDWGDGTVEVYTTDQSPSHTYASPGNHTVMIGGVFPRIYFNEDPIASKIISIDQWGGIQWTSMESAFRGCFNLSYNASDAPDLSNVTSTREMFQSANNFDADIGNWDVSTITDMGSMFHFATNFNGDITGWNVSNVILFDDMFNFAQSFNQDIGGWNVSSMKNADYMFNETDEFNQDLSSWNTSALESAIEMFRNSEVFNGDVSSWNVSNLQDMTSMFVGAGAFDQNLGNWNISSVTSMANMLDNTAMSIENYDATLAGWANNNGGTQTIPNNITLGAANVFYCDAENARLSLELDRNWIITDGGPGCLEVKNDETDITSFSFTQQTASITPDPLNHTIDIEVAFGTDLSNIIASFELSEGATSTIAGVSQESGITANDFSNAVNYLVTAENTFDTQLWTVNVTFSPCPSFVETTLVREGIGDVNADGIEIATLVVQLKASDGSDFNFEGLSVTFSASGDGGITDSESWSDPKAIVANSPREITVSTDANGEARASIANTEEENITVTASIDTNYDGSTDTQIQGGDTPVSINFVDQVTIDDINCGPTGSIITASRLQLEGNGLDESVITVQLRAINDLDLQFENINVKINVTGNALINGQPNQFILTTNSAGVASCRVSNTVGETIQVTGFIDKNQDGQFTLAEQISRGGNQGVIELVFSIDPTPPRLSNTSITDVTSNNGVNFQFESSEPADLFWLVDRANTTLTPQEIKNSLAGLSSGQFNLNLADSTITESLQFSNLLDTTYQLYLVLEDQDGNFSEVSQLSWLSDGIRPTLESAIVTGENPDQVVLIFSEALFLEDSMGWSIKDANLGMIEIESLFHSNNQIILTLSEQMTRSNQLLVSYNHNISNIIDNASNDLRSIVNFEVENSIPSQPPVLTNVALLEILQDNGLIITYTCSSTSNLVWAITTSASPPSYTSFSESNEAIVSTDIEPIQFANISQELRIISPDLDDSTQYYLHVYAEDEFGDRSNINSVSWISDGTGPIIISATVEDATPSLMTVKLNEPAIIGNIGQISLEFPDGTNGPQVLSTTVADNQSITAELSRELTQSDNLRFYYVPGLNDMRDELGNLIEPTYQLPVTNNVKDPPPTIVYFEVRTIVSTDSIAIDFSVDKSGIFYYTIAQLPDTLSSESIINPAMGSVRSDSIVIDSVNKIYKIRYSDLNLTHGERYTFTGVMVDELRNESTLASYSWIADGIRPKLDSAYIESLNPDILLLTFDEPVDIENDEGWSILSFNGRSLDFSNINLVDSSTWAFHLSREVNETDSIRISYSFGNGSVRDPFFNYLAPIESFGVVNEVVGVGPELINVSLVAVNGLSTVTISYETNELGTLYWLVTDTPTPPSQETIKSGDIGINGFGQINVNTVNSQEIAILDVVSLLDSTQYYIHLYQEDEFLNASETVTIDFITPDNAMPVLDPVEIVDIQIDLMAFQFLLSGVDSARVYYAIYNQEIINLTIHEFITRTSIDGADRIANGDFMAPGGQERGHTIYFDDELEPITYYLYVFAVDEEGEETPIIMRSWTPELPPDNNLLIRNLITPNGDGSNDLFHVENLDSNMGKSTLYLYSRQGRNILTINDYHNNYIGVAQELSDLPQGMYICVLSFDDGTSIKETVTILKQ